MDKMMEEFEGWVVSEFDYDVSKSSNGIYYEIKTFIAWQSWRASRAALCVELPEPDVTWWWSAEVLDALDNAGVSYEQNKPLA